MRGITRLALPALLVAGLSIGLAGQAAAETTHYIMAAGLGGDAGTLVLQSEVSAPPFTADVAFASKGSVVPSTGEATVKGTVVCSEQGSVGIVGALRQRAGKTIISGTFIAQVECSTDPTSFTASMYESTGRFVGGKATIRRILIEEGGECEETSEGCRFEYIQGPLAVKLVPR